MAPSTLELDLVENQDNTWVYRRDDITDVDGWSAKMEWRLTKTPAGDELLELSVGSGLTLTADGDGLVLGITLTETQADALVAAAVAGGVKKVWSSLKLITDAGSSEQQFIGQYTIIRTPTT